MLRAGSLPAALGAHPLVTGADAENVFYPADSLPAVEAFARRLLKPLFQSPAVSPLVGVLRASRVFFDQLLQGAFQSCLFLVHELLLGLDFEQLALHIY